MKFLNNDPAGVSISNFSTFPVTDGIGTQMDITITHPLDNAKFDGYDVRGIFIGNGSSTMQYNSDLHAPVRGTDQWLENNDGFTRWYNPTEFTSNSIFGYTPGNLAVPGYIGTATLNPYKYFAEGLGATDSMIFYFDPSDPTNGYFLHGTSNTRQYKIEFPLPIPGIKYGYAITANWAGGDPQYHPSHAPEAIGLVYGTSSNAYYVDETDNGGYAIIRPKIFDWHSELTGGVMLDYNIILESDMFSAPYVFTTSDMTPVESNGNKHTYDVSIPADNLTYSGWHDIWLIVEYPGGDYTNPFGIPNLADTDPLNSIFQLEYSVESSPLVPVIEVLIPNGGEVWPVGSLQPISWGGTTNLPGKVNLFYYKDGDILNPTIIEENAYNIGTYNWEDIPDDPSTTVRLGVESVLIPSLYDVSDADFTIFKPSIEVACPNGGEIWEIGSNEEITWTSDGLTGNVEIHYSKDNFVSDANLIETNVPNTGSYMWNNIPNDPSYSARVRIRSVSDTSIYDVSDIDFRIKQGVTGWAYGTGDSYDDIAYSVARDGQDNAYVVGTYGLSGGGRNGFLYKFNQDGYQGGCEWPSGGSDKSFICNDIAIDNGANVYIVGSFDGVADFDPGTGYEFETSNGGSDAFMVQLDIDFNYQDHWVWGAEGDEVASGIYIDGDWTKYVTGWFDSSTVDFDPGTGTENHSTDGLFDAYVSRFEWNDAHSWTKTWGGTGNDYGKSVVYNGSVYITGDFEGTADFDPHPCENDDHTSEGYTDVFLSNLSSGGDFNWAVAWGGIDEDFGDDIDFDSSGNVFVAGGFCDVVDFDPSITGEDIHTANLSDAYFSKFSSSGDFQFASTWTYEAVNERAYGIEVDGYNNVYVTGTAASTGGLGDFDPTGGEDLKPLIGAFLSKFDTSGNYYWARTWGSGNILSRP